MHLSGHEGVGRVVVDDVEVTRLRARPSSTAATPSGCWCARCDRPTRCARAWAVVDPLWDDAVAHAATLPEPLLHERVDGEWSFVETVRHLVFADDIWVGRMLSDEPGAFHPLGVPPTDTTDAGAAEMGLTLDAHAVVRRGRGPARRAPAPVHRAARAASPTPTCPRCAPPCSPPTGARSRSPCWSA